MNTGPVPSPNHPQRGMTLLEVMIAMAITAMVSALIMGSFARTFRAKELSEAQDERFSSAQTTLNRLARELRQAFLSEHYDHRRFREAPTLFRGKDSGKRDTLLFTTMSHVRLMKDVKESDQALVEYTVEANPLVSGKLALFRREKARLDEDPDHGGGKAVVCEHVVSFDVEYWDWQKQEWVREWVSNAVERRDVLPTRVRIRLGLEMPDGKERIFETQSRIAIIKPLSFI